MSKSHFSAPVFITSGKFRGRKLVTPDTSATHPMGSREKLALFNALISAGADFSADLSVLDLYAGSGALGLEAVSRGATEVVFVDSSEKACRAIKQNAEALEIKNYQIIRGPIAGDQGLPNSFSSSSERSLYNLILVDPPYDAFPTDLSFILPLLIPGGLLALSHPESVDPVALFLRNKEVKLTLLTTKSHAKSRISIFRREN